MASRVDMGPDTTKVIISGDARVHTAHELCRHLRESIELQRPVIVDLAELSSADMSLIQVLLSARTSAARVPMDLTVGSYGYCFEQLLGANGLEHLSEESWFSGSEQVQYFFFPEEPV